MCPRVPAWSCLGVLFLAIVLDSAVATSLVRQIAGGLPVLAEPGV
jgi:hypothetical protein